MRYALDELIVALRTALVGNITYNSSPVQVFLEVNLENDLNSKKPVIVIEPQDMSEFDLSKDSTEQKHTISISVHTKFLQGEGGWGADSDCMNQILQIMRNVNQELDLSGDQFKITTQTVDAISPNRDNYDDGIIFTLELVMEFVVVDLS